MCILKYELAECVERRMQNRQQHTKMKPRSYLANRWLRVGNKRSELKIDGEITALDDVDNHEAFSVGEPQLI